MDTAELLKLVNEKGFSQKEAAEHFGVSRAAVCQKLKRLKYKTTKVIATTKRGKEVIESKINTMQQLSKINAHAVWMLEHVMKWVKGDKTAIQVLESNVRLVNIGTRKDPEYVEQFKFKDPHEIALSAMAEIRGQMKLQLEIYQALFDVQAAQEFQQAVLEVIGEVSEDARSAIIRKLNAKRAIRSAINFH